MDISRKNWWNTLTVNIFQECSSNILWLWTFPYYVDKKKHNPSGSIFLLQCIAVSLFLDCFIFIYYILNILLLKFQCLECCCPKFPLLNPLLTWGIYYRFAVWTDRNVDSIFNGLLWTIFVSWFKTPRTPCLTCTPCPVFVYSVAVMGALQNFLSQYKHYPGPRLLHNLVAWSTHMQTQRLCLNALRLFFSGCVLWYSAEI